MFKYNINRPAIAMLELIFAIVIMGIILMSAPMLMSTAANSGFVAIQQEGINKAATKVNMIMGHHWDERSADENFLDPILYVNNSHSTSLNIMDLNNTRRAGTPRESFRKFTRSDGADLNASLAADFDNAADGDATEDDMDDFHGTSTLTEIDPALNGSDYVEKGSISINTNISYISDAVTGGDYNLTDIVFTPFVASVGTTNIKSIIATLTSTSGVDELNKTIILRAFSSNIGAYKLEERDF